VAALPRAALGSGAQIATFGKTKALLVEYDLVTQPTLNSFSAGLIDNLDWLNTYILLIYMPYAHKAPKPLKPAIFMLQKNFN